MIGDTAGDYAKVCAGLLHPHGGQERGPGVSTSTLSSNPWHDIAARRNLHSEPNVPFLLKTRRIAESQAHRRRWTHSCFPSIAPVSWLSIERGIRNRMAPQSSNGNRPRLSERGLLMLSTLLCAIAIVLITSSAFAATTDKTRQLVQGEKAKVSGLIVSRDGDLVRTARLRIFSSYAQKSRRGCRASRPGASR